MSPRCSTPVGTELLSQSEEALDEEMPLSPLADIPSEKADIRSNNEDNIGACAPAIVKSEVSDEQVQKIKRASKSDRTHKQTVWGVKILTGEFI